VAVKTSTRERVSGRKRVSKPKNLIIVFQVIFNKYEKDFSTIKIFKILSYVRNSWNRFFR